ncbi:hypothetical protein G6011_05587 [Alternaria panax]|uniref:BTB domain-containing protein n=1 Tax=Alternaria panax TaxID=48097 RepID=A0AAD4FDP3_9PLEO|nr:hypothetical protein G6011_05587 [Alternaria panax]
MGKTSATCSFEELIQSKLFTFYIGKEKKAFVVHSAAIAATSWHFHALVNNGMAQSQEGSVEYHDMEPDDFARYVEYAYRCDYTVPHWALDDEVPEESEPEVAVEDEPTAAPEEPPPPPAADPDQGWEFSSHSPSTSEPSAAFGQLPKKKEGRKEGGRWFA